MFKLVMTCMVTSILAATATATAAEMPDVVRPFAEAYARSPLAQQQPASASAATDDYARWFLQGFTHPGYGTQPVTDLRSDAYANGQIYARAHPSERDAVLAAYGYQAVERTGAWRRGFETTAFLPDDAEKESWWMTSYGGVGFSAIGLADSGGRHPPTRVRITGYLSPRGDYGHMGGYRYEVLVTSGALIDADAK